MDSRFVVRLFEGACVAAMTAALSTMGAAAQDNLSGSVSLWGGAHLTSAAEIVLEGFSKEHPDVGLSYEKYPFNEYPTKMRLQLSAGSDTPDVMIIHDFLVDSFIQAGWLADVSAQVSEDAFLRGSLDNVTRDGKVFGIPGQSNPTGLWYRGDIFDALGLSAPETLDDYLAAAKTLKGAGYFIDTFDPNDATRAFQLYLYQAGGTIFDRDGTIVLGDKAVEVIKLLKEMADNGYFFEATANQADYWSAVNSGQIVARFAPSSDAAYFGTNVDPAGNGGYGEWNYANPPQFGEDAPKTYLFDESFLVVNAHSKNLEAAIAVAVYLTTNEDAALVYDSIDRSGIVVRQTPSDLKALKAVEDGGSGWEFYSGEAVNAIKANLLLSADPGAVHKDSRWNAATEVISLILPEVFAGHMTAEDAAEQMKLQIELL